MNVGIRCVLPRSSVSAAALVPRFDEEKDYLALAYGRDLVYGPVESLTSWKPKRVSFFGRICGLVALSSPHSLESNLLVIFDNFKAAVVDSSGKDCQTLNLRRSLELRMPAKLKVVGHPMCVAVVFSDCCVSVFPVSSKSRIERGFVVEIGCKRIRDVCFAGSQMHPQLVVLTETFSNSTSLHKIYLDLENRTYEHEREHDIEMPIDTYIVTSVRSNDMLAVSFASNRALFVPLCSWSASNLKTATIFTTDRIVDMRQMSDGSHVCVNRMGEISRVDLRKAGSLMFTTLYRQERVKHGSFLVIPLDDRLVFVGNRCGDSFVLNLLDGASMVKRFPSTGEVTYSQPTDSGYFVKSERSSINIRTGHKVELVSVFPLKGFETIWCGSSPDTLLLSRSCGTIEVSVKGRRVMNSKYESECPTLFAKCVDNTFVWMTTELLSIGDGFKMTGKFVACDAHSRVVCAATSSECHLLGIDGSDIHVFRSTTPIRSVTVSEDFVAILTDRICVYSLKNYVLLTSLDGSHVGEICFDASQNVLALAHDNTVILHGIRFSSSRIISRADTSFSLDRMMSGVVISGTTPVMWIDNQCVSLGDAVILSAAEQNGSIFSLTNEAVQELKVSPGLVESSACDLATGTVAALSTTNGTLTVMESDGSLQWSVDGGVLAPIDKHNIKDWKVYHDFIYILFEDSVCCYQYDGSAVYKLHEMPITDGLKIHRAGGKLFISTQKAVIQYPDGHIALSTTGQISRVGLSDKYAAVVDSTGSLILYSRDDYSDRYLRIASNAYSDSITAIAILGDRIICSTSDRQLILFNIFPGIRPGEYDISLCDRITTGDSFTSLHLHAQCILGTTAYGSIFEITALAPIPDFHTIYSQLAKHITSPGNLTKLDEQRTFFGRQYPGGTIFDLELIFEFARLDASQQAQILPNTSPLTLILPSNRQI